MSINASAELIFGIPIQRYNDDWEPTGWWIDRNEDGYWRDDLGPVLEIVPYGDYRNEDEACALLTIKSVPRYSGGGDLGERCEIAPNYLHVSDTDLRAAKVAVSTLGLDVSFNNAAWFLVASVG